MTIGGRRRLLQAPHLYSTLACTAGGGQTPRLTAGNPFEDIGR